MEIWELSIYCDNGPAYSILGDDDEDTFKAELIAWRAYQGRDNQVPRKRRRISKSATSTPRVLRSGPSKALPMTWLDFRP